jgi:hypothetical protein
VIKRHTARGSRRRRRIACLVAVAALACAAVEPAPSAGADPSTNGTAPATAAGLTPLLRILDFGAAIGLPLACNLVTSFVTAGAAQLHQGHAVSGIVTQILDQCNALSEAGDASLHQAIDQSKSLTLIDPVLNPVIAALATGSHSIGADHAAAVAPFGPTIDGLGGTLAFFEGS